MLSDSNIGLTGALKLDKQFDYYEMRERSLNCGNMYICNNHKCINQTQVCDGKNNCGDRSDESICTADNLDYDIRLAGANNNYEGRIEVKSKLKVLVQLIQQKLTIFSALFLATLRAI